MRPIRFFALVMILLAGVLLGRSCGSTPPSSATSPSVGSVAVPPKLQLTPSFDPLRRGADLLTEPVALPLARVENVDLKRARSYPMQPPTIPHAIDGYQIDQNANRCMLCHSQANAAGFQAPPVSVTHYMDRDGQVLAEISPRRYFCEQCHVVQTDAVMLVGNQFVGSDDILAQPASGDRGKR